jgi:hypothetical protein
LIDLKEFSSLQDRFYQEVDTATSNSQMEIIDFIVHWCDKQNIEIESIASLVKANAVFKSILLREAKVLNFIKKEA